MQPCFCLHVPGREGATRPLGIRGSVVLPVAHISPQPRPSAICQTTSRASTGSTGYRRLRNTPGNPYSAPPRAHLDLAPQDASTPRLLGPHPDALHGRAVGCARRAVLIVMRAQAVSYNAAAAHAYTVTSSSSSTWGGPVYASSTTTVVYAPTPYRAARGE
ncbi:hypothetical protein PHLGIDRAFT_253559 [Phlebiopsis gigantea 11061_1 CR5-6]|uniref:Uncharacterized protein n=1 Tax=Phlebiopsis gigantea (strain 11061_1 CR5-6) TaxID=745531 RepID=A0A0C3S1J2_PHLG1|nr:hypothetical protein PHLGIDRAFT_253559 [Phlebiopsis gigantea 11061_1 CR5-6]